MDRAGLLKTVFDSISVDCLKEEREKSLLADKECFRTSLPSVVLKKEDNALLQQFSDRVRKEGLDFHSLDIDRYSHGTIIRFWHEKPTFIGKFMYKCIG